MPIAYLIAVLALIATILSSLLLGGSVFGGGFDPANNDVECIYGPPEMFDPSYNVGEDIYGPPEMFDPDYDEDWDDLDEDWDYDWEYEEYDESGVEDDEDIDDITVDDYDPGDNVIPLIYGPPEMMGGD